MGSKDKLKRRDREYFSNVFLVAWRAQVPCAADFLGVWVDTSVARVVSARLSFDEVHDHVRSSKL